ncbi:MAG: catechol 2,3-dioxygenase-like lactoylglutathione lyase family enzyme [Myxococcota bacterium]|jgi:catechol 2,3-dioxygenase-like lactoylglutathione lyase family enzyme
MSSNPVHTGIRGVHHMAFRVRDSEATRRFYEDFLGLPLATSLEIGITKTGRRAQYLHTFYEMDNGGYLAFFEAPGMPFEFTEQSDFDLHIALEVAEDTMLAMKAKAEAEGREVRGVADHDWIHSIYFRDPSGYVVELTCKQPNHDEETDPAKNDARSILAGWTRAKRAAGYDEHAPPGAMRFDTGKPVHGTAGETLD